MKTSTIALLCGLGVSCISSAIYADAQTTTTNTPAANTLAAENGNSSPMQVAWWYGHRGGYCYYHPYRCGRGGYYYGGGRGFCYYHPWARGCYCWRHPGRC